MDELLQKLQSLHGLTAEQSRGILGTITAHIKEKFPMVAGAIDNLFPQGTTSPSTSGANAGDQATAGTSSQGSGDILDKISGIIPGAEPPWPNIKNTIAIFILFVLIIKSVKYWLFINYFFAATTCP